LACEFPSDFLLVDSAGAEVAIKSLVLGLRNSSGFDYSLGNLGGILLEFLVSDAIGPEQVIHAMGGIQLAELALEDEAIKTRQDASDE
jgi:hypothetical protein